jgi:Heavy metal associated domain 2
MADLPEARVCHFTPNRVRLRIPERRHDRAFFESVKRQLSQWQGVERVEVNPATASVLIHYSDGPAFLAEHYAENNLFTVGDIQPDGSGLETLPAISIAQRTRSGVEAFDKAVQRLSGGQADLRSLVVLGLLGSGVVQLLRGNVAVPAITLFWCAGDALRLWRDDRFGAPVTGGNERT